MNGRGDLFSYVGSGGARPGGSSAAGDPGARRTRRWRALDEQFDGALFADSGGHSIPPEKLLRATLLQAFFSVRSERQLMEQIDYNLLFRWFVGLPMDAAVWDHPTCSPRTATGCWRPRWRAKFLARAAGASRR